jgi:hypothetical protein
MRFRQLVPLLTVAAVPVLLAPAWAQVCGNSIVEPPEECDPPGSISCPPGSPGGAFQACGADCSCPAALDHFQCYDGRARPSIRVRGVTLVDQFGTLMVDAFGPTDLCAPANKDDEDRTAPDHPAHLASYDIKSRGRFEPIKDQLVVNQFGSVTVDVIKPTSLLVPTAKSLTGPPSPLGAFVDHFACYKVKSSRHNGNDDNENDQGDSENGQGDNENGQGHRGLHGHRGQHGHRGLRGQAEGDENGSGDGNGSHGLTVTVETQFETVEVDVRQPRELCAPADKNGENPGAEDHPNHLLCYDIKSRQKFQDRDTFLNNQFGEQRFEVQGRDLLCVPSQKNPGTTTTTTVPTTTTTTATAPTTTTTTVPTTTSTTVTTTTTTTTTSTTLYGSPSRAFLLGPRDLLE